MEDRSHSIIWLFYYKCLIPLHTPKLDEIKNRDLDGIGWNEFHHISFHPLFAKPNNEISSITTSLHYILSHTTNSIYPKYFF